MTGSPVIRVIDCHVARQTADGWRYLLMRRGENRVDPGRWRIVTGKIEHGETAWQAALRELREETALTPDRFFAVPYVNHFYEWREDRVNAVPVFLAVVAAGAEPALNQEHVEARWLPLDAAAEALDWPEMREGLRIADALLTGGATPPGMFEIPLGSNS